MSSDSTTDDDIAYVRRHIEESRASGDHDRANDLSVLLEIIIKDRDSEAITLRQQYSSS